VSPGLEPGDDQTQRPPSPGRGARHGGDAGGTGGCGTSASRRASSTHHGVASLLKNVTYNHIIYIFSNVFIYNVFLLFILEYIYITIDKMSSVTHTAAAGLHVAALPGTSRDAEAGTLCCRRWASQLGSQLGRGTGASGRERGEVTAGR